MRNQMNCLMIAFCLLQFSCKRHEPLQGSFDFKPPTIAEAKAYKVPLKNRVPPKVIRVNGVKKIIAGKPEIIKLTSNVFPAQHINVLQASAPAKKIFGKDGYQSPVTILAKDSPFIAGIPEVVTIKKDFYSKDENPESFSSMGVAHGLKYAEVNALCKDRAGNLWIATWDGGGVSKYDGRTLTNYSVGQGLSSEHAFSLLEDREGNMWIGTDHSSVNKFNGKFITRYNVGFGTSNNFVLDMMQDRNGSIWFATPKGVIRYDGNFFIHYTTSQGLTDNGTSCIFEDSKGNIWAGTDGGICKFDGRVFQNYNNVFNLWKDVKVNGEVKSILEDKRGNLWIGTNNDGLYQQNGNLISHFTAQTGLSSNYISSLAEDQKGNIWIATYDSGLNKFDGTSFTQYSIEQGLTSESIFTLLIDKSGTIWLGTAAGINRYDGGLFSHVQAIQGSNRGTIVCMNADKNKNLWIGGRASLNKYDGKSITSFTPSQGLQNYPVTDILEDRQGNIWMATWMGGVNKFDGTSFTQYSTANGLIDNEVIDILEDKKGTIWIGTDGGVSKFDGKYFTNYSTANGLISDDINSLFVDQKDNLWFGTRDKGLSKFDGISFTNYHINNGLGGAAITCISEDEKNNLWLGTNEGLIKFDGKNFTRYTAEQGLNGNIVTNILSCKNGEMWIGTNNGLNRFDGHATDAAHAKKASFSLFKKYTSSEGFLGVWAYYKTMIEDTSGGIWIGASDRLTKYHPEGDIPDTIPPTVQLSGLALFDEEIKWWNLEKKKDSSIILNNGVRLKNFNFTGLSSWYNQPQNLQLAYNNNYITFHFIGITTNRPKEVRYQYFLEGLDKNWSAITNEPEATYNNLPHGKYIFKVKAANSEGYWSNELNYSFSILPPWWQTWWAYMLYALVFFIALIVFIKWREKALRKEKVVLEEKVNRRTQELQKEKEKVESSLEQVQALQAQLVETEKINERLRISQELHDDIGGTLSGIVLYSHLAENQMQSQHTDEVERSLNMIQQSANDMVNKLSDIIWSVNPEHNSIKNLFQKLREYATEMATAKNIKVRVDSPEYLAELQLPVNIRHNVYLLFKEAINNAVKYSEASLLQLSIHHHDHTVEFIISDNGKGFDITTAKTGNGLMNMLKRANDIKAKFCLQSIPQKGTVVSLQCSIEVPS